MHIQKNIYQQKITTIKDVRDFPTFIISFSQEMLKTNQLLKIFLMKKMYRHKIVNVMTHNANEIIGELFDYYFTNPLVIANYLKDQSYLQKNPVNQANLIANYIAGMTDRFAINEHKTLILKN